MTATLRKDIHHSEKKIKNSYKDKITTINLWKDDIYSYSNLTFAPKFYPINT